MKPKVLTQSQPKIGCDEPSETCNQKWLKFRNFDTTKEPTGIDKTDKVFLNKTENFLEETRIGKFEKIQRLSVSQIFSHFLAIRKSVIDGTGSSQLNATKIFRR